MTYVAGETLTLEATFPFDMTLNTSGGSPRIALTVGASTKYATFVSQPSPRLLRFSYSFIAGDDDTNGIDINALELNSSTIKFDKSGIATDCDVSTVTTTNYPLLKVDTSSPTISAFSLLNLVGLYRANEVLNFRMTFSESVYVTGTPKFVINLGGTSVDINYNSGSGSNVLLFNYTISTSVVDTNGYNSITSPIALNSGTIKDAVGNNSSLDFSAFIASVITYSNNVDVNGQYPYVIGKTFPANGTYLANDELDFKLTFDRAVNVSGTPYLSVVIGANTRQAQYVAGHGTTELTFRYTAIPGDVDSDGIAVSSSITQNSGNIVSSTMPSVSYFTDSLNNSFSIPNTTGILLNAIQPQATAVARNVDSTIPVWGGSSPDNIWIIGQDLNITVSFNTPMYVTQTGGTPYIALTIGSTLRQASYLSGGNGQTSLIFRYVIQETDLDSDGTIGLGNIVLNGGVITDIENTNTLLTLPSAGLATTQIDGVRPTISSIAPPVDATYSLVSPSVVSMFTFIVTWSEAVNYSATGTAGDAYLSIDIGGSTVRAEWNLGNNQAAITHRPTSISGRNDSDGITLVSPFAGSATIKDQAGNVANVFNFTSLPTPAGVLTKATSGILVDTTAPTVTSVVPAITNGTYKQGDQLNFTVTFSESVTTVVNSTHPRISITIGSSTKLLVATTSTTSTTHTFRYTVLAGDTDADGIVLSNSVVSNGTTAYARDIGRNNVVGTFAVPTTSGIKVDTTAPGIPTAVASSNQTYTSGDALQIAVTYSENIFVDTALGTPYININFKEGTDHFEYSSGSGTSTLIFQRVLDSNHFDMDGLPSSVTTIEGNGGLLTDGGGNSAPLTFSAINLSQIYVTYPEVKLWTKSNFTNIAPGTSASINSTGTGATSSCGLSGTCRDFDGTDSLSLTSGMTGIESVFMVFKTPSVLADHDIFDTSIGMREDAISSKFDLNTETAETILDGVSLGSTISHDTDLDPSSTHILQTNFTTAVDYNTGILIDTSFNGSIGEIIAIEGALNSTKLTNIRTYLDDAYNTP